MLARACLISRAEADEPCDFTQQQLTFVESKIRPVLVEHCYECHAAGAKFVQGGLRVGHRTGLLRYRPVLTTHELPQLAGALPLWNDSQTLPKAAELPQVAGAEFHVIKKPRPDTDGCKFTLGVGLAWHKGKLYASYACNKGNENTPTEEAHVRVSGDGGKTWEPPVVMDAGEGDLAVSHGVFLSHGGKLWAFMGAFYAHAQLYHRVHTRAYWLNETTGAWEPQGAIVDDGFWPMQEPQKMADAPGHPPRRRTCRWPPASRTRASSAPVCATSCVPRRRILAEAARL